MNQPRNPLAGNQMGVTMKLIWGALTISQLLYLAVLQVSAESLRARAEAGGPPLEPTLFQIIAVAIVVVSLVFRRVFLSEGRLRAIAGSVDPTDAESLAAAKAKIVRAAFVPSILNWALNEAVVLVGFVLAFGNRSPVVFYPFLAMGFILNLLMFPREAAWIRKAGLPA